MYPRGRGFNNRGFGGYPKRGNGGRNFQPNRFSMAEQLNRLNERANEIMNGDTAASSTTTTQDPVQAAIYRLCNCTISLTRNWLTLSNKTWSHEDLKLLNWLENNEQRWVAEWPEYAVQLKAPAADYFSTFLHTRFDSIVATAAKEFLELCNVSKNLSIEEFKNTINTTFNAFAVTRADQGLTANFNIDTAAWPKIIQVTNEIQLSKAELAKVFMNTAKWKWGNGAKTPNELFMSSLKLLDESLHEALLKKQGPAGTMEIAAEAQHLPHQPNQG